MRKLPLGDRFHEVAAKLASDDPSVRRYGWDEAFRAYEKWIKDHLAVRAPQSQKGRVTLGPGESVSDIENTIWTKGANVFQRKAKNFESEAYLSSYINTMVTSAVFESLRRKPKPARYLPSQSQSPGEMEPPARSGDRPSKADSGDYWNHLYIEIERRFGGKIVAALFREWLRIWCEEKDWHRRWMVLSEFAMANLRVVETPDAIRLRIGRLLGRLQKDKAFCECFHLIPRSDSSHESRSSGRDIPDALLEDPASDGVEVPSDSQT